MDARALLGEDHPLVRNERRLATVSVQLAAALAVALGGLAAGHGVVLASIAGAYAAVGSLIAAALLSERREAARQLIASGREHLPIAAIERERRRLQSERYRQQLARTVESIVRRALERPRPYQVVYVDQAGVRALAPEFREIAALVRRGARGSDRGVAQLSLLISDGPMSPLYKPEPLRLKQELGRIRFALTA